MPKSTYPRINPEEITFDVFDESKVMQKIDYNVALLRQIDRIFKFSAFGNHMGVQNSVNWLGMALSPYYDTKYNNAYDQLNEYFIQKFKKLSPLQQEMKESSIKQLFIMRKFGLLMELMGRKDFLPEIGFK